MRCLCLFLLCASLCVPGGDACAGQKFDMEQAVLHALDSNPSVESASLAAEAAASGRKAARSVPHLPMRRMPVPKNHGVGPYGPSW